jgi:co-chaperonin GroES (HSP10)
MDKENVNPQGVNALVEVKRFDTLDSNKIYKGENAQMTKTKAEFYFGTVIKLGKDAASKEQCSELKEGIGVVISQMAGYTIPTKKSYCKVVRGYDVVAIVEDLDNINMNNIKPTGDRVLVQIIEESSITSDGVYVGSKEDPREALIQRGRVISCAENAIQYKEGSIVAFDPYCGNLIYNEGDVLLKTVNGFDILFLEE